MTFRAGGTASGSAGDDHVFDVVDLVHRRLVDGDEVASRDGVLAAVRDVAPLMGGTAVESAVSRVLARVGGLGPLDDLLAADGISDVLVNGDGAVWIEHSGHLRQTELRLGRGEVELLIERVISPLGLRIDRSSPLVDARLPDGSRFNAIVPPVAVDGPCVSIRRFGVADRSLGDLCSPSVEALLSWAVRARLNMAVIGGTGAGKTTLLNAIAGRLSPTERVVTIEDTAELRLFHGHAVRLEARPGNADGVGDVTIRDLVRNALRMRPDRIIVGECRGPEALDMLQAMNTGHEGSLTTCHANGAPEALRRLETMVLTSDVGLPLAAIREQIRSALDLVVSIVRHPDGSRRVGSVDEVVGDVAAEPSRDAIAGLHTRPLTVDGCLTGLPERHVRVAGAGEPSDAWLELQ